jgi:hypothetical protein
VLAGFVKHIIRTAHDLNFGNNFPKHFSEVSAWNIGNGFEELFDMVKNDAFWWLNMPLNDCIMPFPDIKVDCYITARPIPSQISEIWVAKMGLQEAPVFTVQHAHQKAVIGIERGLTHFVDDKPSTVREMNWAGIDAYLYRTPANRHEREGLNCISSLTELYNILGVCEGC